MLIKSSRYSPRKDSRNAGRVNPIILSGYLPSAYVHKIAPRPLLFQNALNDDLIPRSSVEILYNTAGPPKQIIWYDCVHGRIEKDAVVNIVRDGLAWLKNQQTLSAKL